MKALPPMTPIELRQQGFAILIQHLGVVNTLRFLHQYDLGHGDYTAERHQWLPKKSVRELAQELRSSATDNKKR